MEREQLSCVRNRFLFLFLTLRDLVKPYAAHAVALSSGVWEKESVKKGRKNNFQEHRETRVAQMSLSQLTRALMHFLSLCGDDRHMCHCDGLYYRLCGISSRNYTFGMHHLTIVPEHKGLSLFVLLHTIIHLVRYPISVLFICLP